MTINIDHLRWSLEELASIEEQKLLWFGASPGEMSSFEEAICGVFDDAGVTRALDKGLILQRYGSEIAELFKSLDTSIHKVPLNLKPDDLIELPIMDEIRTKANLLLQSKIFSEGVTR